MAGKNFVSDDLTCKPGANYCVLRKRFHRENKKFDFRELKFQCGMVRLVELAKSNDGNICHSLAEIITNIPRGKYYIYKSDIMNGARKIEAENFDHIPKKYENLFLLDSRIPVNVLHYSFPPDLVKQAEEFYRPLKVPAEYKITQEIDRKGSCTLIMADQENVDRELENLERNSFVTAFENKINIGDLSVEPGSVEIKDGYATHYVMKPGKS